VRACAHALRAAGGQAQRGHAARVLLHAGEEVAAGAADAPHAHRAVAAAADQPRAVLRRRERRHAAAVRVMYGVRRAAALRAVPAGGCACPCVLSCAICLACHSTLVPHVIHACQRLEPIADGVPQQHHCDPQLRARCTPSHRSWLSPGLFACRPCLTPSQHEACTRPSQSAHDYSPVWQRGAGARADGAIAPAGRERAAVGAEGEARAGEPGLPDALQLPARVQRPHAHIAAAACGKHAAVAGQERDVGLRVLRRRARPGRRKRLRPRRVRASDGQRGGGIHGFTASAFAADSHVDCIGRVCQQACCAARALLLVCQSQVLVACNFKCRQVVWSVLGDLRQGKSGEACDAPARAHVRTPLPS